MDDEDLQAIERIRSGEIQAYALLVWKYQGRIRGYCLGVLGNSTEAEDAAQEVFIKGYRGLKSFRGAARFSTWIYRIAVNHCRDLLRKAARERTESWEALREREGESLEAKTAVLPESRRVDERAEQAREALSTLSEEDRTILVLREAQGLSYQELAETLGCTVEAVRSRLRRARQALETRLRARV